MHEIDRKRQHEQFTVGERDETIKLPIRLIYFEQMSEKEIDDMRNE